MIATLTTLCLALQATTSSVQSVQSSPSPSSTVELTTRSQTGAVFRTPQGLLTIAFWGDRTVGVTIGKATGLQDIALIGVPMRAGWTIREEVGRYVLTTAAMRVGVDKASGTVALLDANDHTIVTEADPGSRQLGDLPNPDGAVAQRFAMTKGQSIYGLGQHQTGLLDYRGTTVRLQQANTDVGVPVLISTSGYGIFWNRPCENAFAEPELAVL